MRKVWVLGLLLVLGLSSLALTQERGNREQIALGLCGGGQGNQWHIGRKLSTLDTEAREEVLTSLRAAMDAGDREAVAEIMASLPEPVRPMGNGGPHGQGQGRMHRR